MFITEWVGPSSFILNTHDYIYIYTYIIRLYICVYVYVYVYIYIYTHTYLIRKHKLVEKVLLTSISLYICEDFYFVYLGNLVIISGQFILQIFLELFLCASLF